MPKMSIPIIDHGAGILSSSAKQQARNLVLNAIDDERDRQNRLKAEGRFKETPDEMSVANAGLALGEEYGEVCRASMAVQGIVQESDDLDMADLYTELIHVAAVAAAIAEGIVLGTLIVNE